MEFEWQEWQPKALIMCWRGLGLLLLSMLWLQDQGYEAGVVLLLLLCLLALARWRFNLPPWILLFDQAACLLLLPFWPHSVYGLAFPLFEAALSGKLYWGIPMGLYFLFFPQGTLGLILVYLFALLSGLTLGGWQLEREQVQHESDRQRKSLYELERLKGELLLAYTQAARSAELTERNRIAQELHDHVGHEITAAVLALQAFEQLWKEQDPQASEMFYQAQLRLSNSARQLREAVHNMKPNIALGVDRLKEICDGFTACPITFQIYGNTLRVPAYLWGILEPCLKEALTNVLRHSEATRVEVKLDVGPQIVRLSVVNDGVKADQKAGGVGLRNLRLRAKAIGGSIAYDAQEEFRLICVLPMAGDSGGGAV